jgi:uncharacterized protein DUF4058
MPIHDWTRVSDGDFHDLHQSWAVVLRTALNNGILPPDYYAQIERAANRTMAPDVLTLSRNRRDHGEDPGDGAIAVKQAPPKVSMTATAEKSHYMKKQSRVAIRKTGKDEVVAFIEIISPGNKESQKRMELFVNKVDTPLEVGIHLLIIDLFPPTPRDPNGIHSRIWEYVEGTAVAINQQRPLTLAAYVADGDVTSYVESAAVGMPLPDMPLFLTDEHYVNVPLESTYMEAFRGVPRQIRDELEAANLS